MKIQTENRQPAAAGQGAQHVAKSDPSQEAAGPGKKGAPAGQDSVELSAALGAGESGRRLEQEERVADIKRRIASGEYRVDSRDVAEKILSGGSKK